MKKGRILLAEDDTNLGFVIKDNLETANFEVELYPDGEMALTAFQHKEFDMCILDVMMPKKDGFSVAQAIQKLKPEVPFVFLTAKSMKEDQLKGLKMGADDYITKPFSIEILLQKVENILKRSQKNGGKQPAHRESFDLGNYEFDFKNQLLKLGKQQQELTQREADLLRLFVLNKNNVVERDKILNLLWGNDSYFTGRSLDVFISRLRKYLKDDSNIEISNIHSVGFKLVVKE
jgi:DNA-binding response OmpR family regulator